MALATHQPAPSDTQGNASRQLAVVVVFGRRVVPALCRLTFANTDFLDADKCRRQWVGRRRGAAGYLPRM